MPACCPSGMRPCSGSAPMAAACRSSSSACPGSRPCRSACVTAGLAAAVIGWFATRTRGIYFAMVTLALSQVVYYIVFQWVSLTGGENGLRGVNVPAIDVFGLRLNLARPDDEVLRHPGVRRRRAVGCSRASSHSPFGAVIEAIRENERARRAPAATTSTRTRWLVFVLSGAVLGPGRRALRASTCPIVPIETLHYFNSGQRADDDAARRHGHLLRPVRRRLLLPPAAGRDRRS